MLIDQSCPQCGAPVVLNETDRLLACPYCRVRLFMKPRDLFRYRIPPRPNNARRPDLIYVPYARFRGMVFDLEKPSENERVLDHNFLAVRTGMFPDTLGLRPQTLRLRPAVFRPEDRCLIPATKPADFLQPAPATRAPSPISGRRPSRPRTTSVGEVRSLIYAPYYQTRGLWHDAVTDQPLETLSPADREEEFQWDTKKDWDPAFIPALCPECGWDLAAEKESCIVFCTQCRTGWEPLSDGLHGIRLFSQPVTEYRDQLFFLPFWRFRLPFAPPDHYRLPVEKLFEIPVGRNPEWLAEKTRALYWVPAFKISPRIFLRLGLKTTQVAFSNPDLETRLPDTFHPVTLPAEEAFAGIAVLQASLDGDQIVLSSSLPSIEDQDWEKDLVFLPFQDTPYEFIQPRLGLGISKNALNLGKYI